MSLLCTCGCTQRTKSEPEQVVLSSCKNDAGFNKQSELSLILLKDAEMFTHPKAQQFLTNSETQSTYKCAITSTNAKKTVQSKYVEESNTYKPKFSEITYQTSTLQVC
ncbi:hypothetical protein KC19_9G097500 [Ceratodon purpureus]|uniref:Uncharacterized protein n=1 Tax=Ceratodon purpureus TaxID=3225 RepID=A0A8T0GU16_CERPU|nr:hypothetical protein KC19_9G097500 [Ceratodon purpureus]